MRAVAIFPTTSLTLTATRSLEWLEAAGSGLPEIAPTVVEIAAEADDRAAEVEEVVVAVDDPAVVVVDAVATLVVAK